MGDVLGFEQFQIVFRKASCPAPTNWVDAVRSQPGFQIPHRPLQAKRRLAKGQVAAGNHVVASVPAVLPLRCDTTTDATPAAHRTVSSWARDVPVNLFSEPYKPGLVLDVFGQRDLTMMTDDPPAEPRREGSKQLTPEGHCACPIASRGLDSLRNRQLSEPAVHARAKAQHCAQMKKVESRAISTAANADGRRRRASVHRLQPDVGAVAGAANARRIVRHAANLSATCPRCWRPCRPGSSLLPIPRSRSAGQRWPVGWPHAPTLAGRCSRPSKVTAPTTAGPASSLRSNRFRGVALRVFGTLNGAARFHRHASNSRH